MNQTRKHLGRLTLLVILLINLGACSTVKAGQVGVQTKGSGEVKACGIKPGRVWHLTGNVDTFTTRLQNSYMTAGKEGDRSEPDDVKVGSTEGAGVSADIQIGYTLQSDPKTICRVYNEIAKNDDQV